ncbi:drebrin-like protein [Neocloeon triangulifer]|uniref:drebrin-like protein n=1 Tax=Neocloeon triangulifer TaxID=2078957 RepID=UPI00286F49F5|nr:drebrin-like protein [Neocloeon triangulifer]XP_059488602.1 drebrin-like protein [Neocloeon triangulifer]
MAVDLTKNRSSIVSAWTEVVDDKNPIDWALFGYEGQTNVLKVVSKGDGGIEELVEDLSSGKIMYGFVKVLDPKTSLPKCVLINWQGDGAPLVRKGVCANHIHEVSKLLHGAHVTINARNEDEVDLQIVIEKVSKATSSAYSFKDRMEPERAAPVGTKYEKLNPAKEINSSERDRFWEKEEQEEKKRQAEEKRKREEETKRSEEERIKLEEKSLEKMQKKEDEWTQKHPEPKKEEKVVVRSFVNPPKELNLNNGHGNHGNIPTNSEEQLSPLAEAQRTLARFDDVPAPMQLSPDNETPAEPVQNEPVPEQESQPETPPSKEDYGIRARALYDYQAADATEISFDPDDVITHIDLIDEGWWQGLGPDGTYGLFPANYVEIITEE